MISKIKCIKKLENFESDRYDIQVQDNENFFANGLLVHNCRLAAFVNQGEVKYVSRSGKPSDHLVGLFDAELVKLEEKVGEPIVVDGEVLASSFQETMNAKGSDRDEAKNNLKFWTFDYMTLNEWNAQSSMSVWESNLARITKEAKKDPVKGKFRLEQHLAKKPVVDQRHMIAKFQIQRSTELESMIKSLGLKKIVKTKYKICNSIQELRDFYAEVLAEGVNDDGTLNGLGEGLIIKNLKGTYEWDRSKFWVKWKPVIDLDLQIVGYEPGKGRLSNTIGKLLLEGTDENGNHIKARCGSGLSDKDRDFFLKNQARLLGTTVMIEAQEISLASNSDVYSARFPVFIKIRNDL